MEQQNHNKGANKQNLAGLEQRSEDSVEASNNTAETIQSPVLNALRSHLQRWYPETMKHNRLELDDMIGDPEC